MENLSLRVHTYASFNEADWAAQNVDHDETVIMHDDVVNDDDVRVTEHVDDAMHNLNDVTTATHVDDKMDVMMQNADGVATVVTHTVDDISRTPTPVSYTHLTLPTKRIV